MASGLYLVRGNDADGENQDLFVVAAGRRGAIAVWNDYCVQEGWPRIAGDDEEAPRSRTVDPENVREILPDVTGTVYAGSDRAIGWDDLPII